MSIKEYQALTKLETKYYQDEQPKHLSPMEGRSILRVRTNVGTMSIPIWEITELYTLTVEDLTVELSKIQNQRKAELNLLEEFNKESEQMQRLQENINAFCRKANTGIQNLQIKQKNLVALCTAKIDTALEQKQVEGASIMQTILTLIEHTQSELGKLDAQVKKIRC